MEEKKSIFVSLGWNYTLKDKKLIISKHEWINSVESKKKSIELHLNTLEPEESLTEKRKREAFTSLRPLLRSEWDLNPRPPP